MSTNFGSKDGVLIRSMTLEDYDQVKLFMKEHFYRDEPLCAFAGEDYATQFQQCFRDYHISIIKEGTCLVAIDEEKPDRILGLVLAGTLVSSDLEEQHRKNLERDPCALKPIELFMSGVELKANVFQHYGVSKLLYSHLTNVAASMRGKGLGTRLAAALMEVGRSRGFTVMSATCTSFYSARQKQAMGWKCIYSEAYADHKDQNGQVVIKPPEPHTHIRVFAVRL